MKVPRIYGRGTSGKMRFFMNIACFAATGVYGYAIMMKNDPIKMKGTTIKTRKGVRS